MPYVFKNYTHFEIQQLQNFSPITPEQLETMFTYNDHLKMTTARAYSPSSVESIQQMEVTEAYSTEQYVDIINQSKIISICNPELKILIQPVEKFRFRYKSEMMGTHGSLLGERDESNHKKEVPAVQLLNCPVKDAIIRCTLVTADEDRRFPHAHRLVRKDGNDYKEDPHDIKVFDQNNYTAMFYSMGIIHTAKKNIKDEIVRKKTIELREEKKRKNSNDTTITTREDLEIKYEAEQAKKWMNLNSVALCFQAFVYGEDNVLHPITEKVYSRAINNLKSALTGELKICRINKITSCCEGNEEIWLLVEKVGRKNIKIKFYEMDEKDNIIWEAEGRFSELDVHHQYAIVLRTPPYKDVNITMPKEVFLRLERPSDGETSNVIKFHYKPSDKTLSRKRPRLSSISKNLEEFKNYQHNQLRMPMAEGCRNINDTDISNISEELRKLINDTNDNNYSEELKKFSASSFLNDFVSLLVNQTQSTQQPENFLPFDLVSDGMMDTTELEKSHEDFAKSTLQSVMKALKETESANGSKEEVIKTVQGLLQETTYYGDTPLHYALRYEQYQTAIQIITILAIDPSLKNIVNLQNSEGKTALHFAVLQGKSNIARALLKFGADPNLCDEEDGTPLHNAIIAEANSCIDELLKSEKNLDLEAYTESGWSALHLAAKVGSLHAVRSLIEAGADVNSTDMSYGRTALHIAVDSNHKHIVKYLLAHTSINVNMKNYGGNTALHSAVVIGGKCAEELVRILREHGADPRIRNHNVSRDTETGQSTMSLSEQICNDKSYEISNEKISEGLSKKLNDISIEKSLNKRQSIKSIGHVESDEATGGSSSPIGLLSSIKSESESEDENDGESSFDLAQDDPRLMHLLHSDKPSGIVTEELNLKEEMFNNDICLQQCAMMKVRCTVKEKFNTDLVNKTLSAPKKKGQKKKQSIDLQQQQIELKRQYQLEQMGQDDEKLREVHLKQIIPILDQTGGWEKLAQSLSQGSLVRLLKKADSPSTALFKKIKLTHPNLTVIQMEKLLTEIQSLKAAEELKK